MARFTTEAMKKRSQLVQMRFEVLGLHIGECPNRLLPHDVAALVIPPAALDGGLDGDASPYLGEEKCSLENPSSLVADLPPVPVPVRDVEHEHLLGLT